MSSSSSSSKPPVNFDLTVGYDNGDQPVSWNRRDLLLYSVGIGAGAEDLDYVYEFAHDFRAFPTYPVVLGLKGMSLTRADRRVITDKPIPLACLAFRH